jgi:hypothetical protein
MKPEPRDRPLREFELAKKEYEKAKAETKDAQTLDALKKQVEQTQIAAEAQGRELRPLRVAARFPSRLSPTRETTVTELKDLAVDHRSLPVHPAQLYAATSALLLSGLLSSVFYRRKRHGVVIALMMVLYGVSRTIEETIRVDNPHDVAGLMVSQSISLGLFVTGLGVLWLVGNILHRNKPEEEKDHLTLTKALKRIDMASVVFFIGILLAVASLSANGMLPALAGWLDVKIGNQSVIVIIIGLCSAVIDNIPLVAASMGMYPLAQFPTDSFLWEFIAYCAGTGGSILIIGSAAGVVAMGLEKIEFFWYARRIGPLAFAGYFAGVAAYIIQYNLLH